MVTEIINIIGSYLLGMFIGLLIGVPTGYDKRYFEEKNFGGNKMATDTRRYYCHIRVDSTFNAGNLPLQNIQSLNEKIENVVEEWSREMVDKELSVDVGWDWSEHAKLD